MKITLEQINTFQTFSSPRPKAHQSHFPVPFHRYVDKYLTKKGRFIIDLELSVVILIS